jgi:hypothetical protein
MPEGHALGSVSPTTIWIALGTTLIPWRIRSKTKTSHGVGRCWWARTPTARPLGRHRQTVGPQGRWLGSHCRSRGGVVRPGAAGVVDPDAQ